MSGLREFPEELLRKFDIAKNYHAFLVRESRHDERAEQKITYSFKHEMIYEFFASRYVEKMPLERLKCLLLYVCCETSFHNVQRIMFEVILKRHPQKEELLGTMIRSIQILQGKHTRATRKVMRNLLQLKTNIKAKVSIDQLLLSDHDAKEARAMLNKIHSAFDTGAKQVYYHISNAMQYSNSALH